MKLWIITCSEVYYPREGIGDWLVVTSDEKQARKHFADAKLTAGRDDAVYLIKVTSEGSYNVVDSHS